MSIKSSSPFLISYTITIYIIISHSITHSLSPYFLTLPLGHCLCHFILYHQHAHPFHPPVSPFSCCLCTRQSRSICQACSKPSLVICQRLGPSHLCCDPRQAHNSHRVPGRECRCQCSQGRKPGGVSVLQQSHFDSKCYLNRYFCKPYLRFCTKAQFLPARRPLPSHPLQYRSRTQ